MLFEVLRQGSNNGGSGPKDAAYMQSESLHQRLLEPEYWPDLQPRYEAAKRLPEGALRTSTIEYLKSLAEEHEAKYPKYWKSGNTERPKHGQTSSWVGNINYDPETRTALINIGDKEYTYIGVTPGRMAQLLTSPSIGHMLNEAKVPHEKGEIVYHGF